MQSNRSLYEAFKSKDARFDGQFFVGISTTGIYCRPVCTARVAKAENCNFFKTAAEAEKFGYRPCLICRPELAPSINELSSLAGKVASFIEENCGSDLKLSDLTEQFGYSDRHLRRIFMEAYHVSPVEYLQTSRLLLAKNLLTESSLSITDIAMASGFGSLRRFNEIFKEKYKLTPSGFRQQLKAGKESKSEIKVSLGYKSPYNWEQILNFLITRAIPGMETVKDGIYFRTVRQKASDGTQHLGWISITNLPNKNSLALTVSESLIKVLPQIIAKVKRLFDLKSDPDFIYETLQIMNELKPGLCHKGIRVPGCMDEFELATRTILGQQITIKAASTLAGRIAQNYGIPIDSGIPGLDFVFPSSEDILNLDGKIEENFGSIGIIKTRSRAIEAVAKFYCETGNSQKLSSEDQIKSLLDIPGIGPWTANYIAMRAMGFTDVFLETDYGIKKVLAPLSEKEILKESENWKPWRSYAVVNIWNYLQESEE